jgi:hypothetical protein
MKLLLLALALVLASCSQYPTKRFELMQAGSAEDATVLFDHETGDILVIASYGEIRNVGHFGDRPATGKRR